MNDKDDPGGETKFGISKRSYPDLDIKNITKQQATEIYERDFYNKVRGDDLPVWLALMVADFAVNAGIKPAVAILQRLVNETDDGIMGKKTIAACKSKASRTLRQAYTTGREAYYDALAAKRPTMKRFLNGWKSRTKDCESLATFLDLHP